MVLPCETLSGAEATKAVVFQDAREPCFCKKLFDAEHESQKLAGSSDALACL